jgi:hypothetical protein
MTGNLHKYDFYIKYLLLFIGVGFIIYELRQQKGMNMYVHSHIWLIQVFFFIVGLLSHFFSEKCLNKKGDFFIFYMASMAFRFLMSLIFIFACIYHIEEGRAAFVVNFFILYLVYTAFEIYFLLRNLRPDFKTDGTVDKKS